MRKAIIIIVVITLLASIIGSGLAVYLYPSTSETSLTVSAE